MKYGWKVKYLTLIGVYFIANGAKASGTGGADWILHELGTGAVYKPSRVVEIRRKGDAVCTIPQHPTKPRTQSIMSHSKSSLSLERLIVKDIDGRLRVVSTDKFPDSTHGQISMDFIGGHGEGSGILIGPHHFLTAGHCVFDHKNNWGWISNIRVRLGLNGDAAPFGEVLGTKVYTYNKWVDSADEKYDIALVVLNRSIGHETGWAGLLSLTDGDLLKETVHVTGYPGDKGCKEMWTMDRLLESVNPEQFFYKIDTTEGQSGGAVWIRKWETPHVLGVHTLGFNEETRSPSSRNSGVRLSPLKLETIVGKWIESTGEIVTVARPVAVAGAAGSLGDSDEEDAETLFKRAFQYANGNGVSLNKKEAVKYYTLAANQGYPPAQFALGISYDKGNGVAIDKKQAVKYYTLAADQGHADAQYFLGLKYDTGDGVAVDKEEARRYLALAANQGERTAQFALGLKYARGDGVAIDKTQAIRLWALAADQGHADAQYFLGLKYDTGDGVAVDKEEARRYLALAANQGHADAQYFLGIIYDKGDGVAIDKKEAVKYYTLAADQGLDDAQFILGFKYARGDGVPVNKLKAVKYYTLAADQGERRAQFALGIIYDKGDGVAIDKKEAIRLWALAADQGLAWAQYSLGIIYDKGDGVAIDKKQAVKYYTLAADQGLADAQYFLGIIYDKGDGVAIDKTQAVKYYTLAADQGHAETQYKLGLMYYIGKGVAVDKEEARRYLALAANQGYPNASKILKDLYEKSDDSGCVVQ